MANENAFPTTQYQSIKYEGGHRNGAAELKGGLTKRELFAAMAMQGLCSNSAADNSTGSCNAAIAGRAIIIADRILSELAKDK